MSTILYTSECDGYWVSKWITACPYTGRTHLFKPVFYILYKNSKQSTLRDIDHTVQIGSSMQVFSKSHLCVKYSPAWSHRNVYYQVLIDDSKFIFLQDIVMNSLLSLLKWSTENLKFNFWEIGSLILDIKCSVNNSRKKKCLHLQTQD